LFFVVTFKVDLSKIKMFLNCQNFVKFF
jgi:hypothetical protein